MTGADDRPLRRDTHGRWLVERHQDVAAATRHVALRVGPRALRRRGIDGGPLVGLRERQLINLDGTPHQRLRRMIDSAFGPRAVNSLRDSIQQRCTSLVERMPRGEPFDIVSEYAFLLPITVISDMLGLEHDADVIRTLSSTLVASFDPSIDDVQLAAASTAVTEFHRLIEPVVRDRRDHPRNDLVSRLVHAADDAGIGDLDIIANVVLLVTAGFETTMGLISNSVWLLAANPGPCRQLIENPAFIGNTIEEVLRLESPISSIARMATDTLTIGGSTIEAGDDVVLALAAANRDPVVFENPSTFDITRTPNPHLAFGGGPHFCLGAALARLEGSIALAALLPHLSELSMVADTISWKPHPTVHCPANLMVRIS